jgi:hypothetical protein
MEKLTKIQKPVLGGTAVMEDSLYLSHQRKEGKERVREQ